MLHERWFRFLRMFFVSTQIIFDQSIEYNFLQCWWLQTPRRINIQLIIAKELKTHIDRLESNHSVSILLELELKETPQWQQPQNLTFFCLSTWDGYYRIYNYQFLRRCRMLLQVYHSHRQRSITNTCDELTSSKN